MRTTLDIDDDVLAAVKEISAREKVSAGTALSRLLRKALTADASAAAPPSSKRAKSVGGFRPLPKGGKIVTNADINRLRDLSGV
jgi:hypothetical protein